MLGMHKGKVVDGKGVAWKPSNAAGAKNAYDFDFASRDGSFNEEDIVNGIKRAPTMKSPTNDKGAEGEQNSARDYGKKLSPGGSTIIKQESRVAKSSIKGSKVKGIKESEIIGSYKVDVKNRFNQMFSNGDMLKGSNAPKKNGKKDRFGKVVEEESQLDDSMLTGLNQSNETGNVDESYDSPDKLVSHNERGKSNQKSKSRAKESSHGPELKKSRQGRPERSQAHTKSRGKMGFDSEIAESNTKGSRIRNVSKTKESNIRLKSSSKKGAGWEKEENVDLGATLVASKADKKSKSRVGGKSKDKPMTLQEKLMAMGDEDGGDFERGKSKQGKSKMGSSKVQVSESILGKFGKSSSPDKSNLQSTLKSKVGKSSRPKEDERGGRSQVERSSSPGKSRAKESRLESSKSPEKSRAQLSEMAQSKADRLKMSKKPIYADSEIVQSQSRALGSSQDRTKKSFMPDSMIASKANNYDKSKRSEDERKHSKPKKLKGSREAEQWGSSDEPDEKPQRRTKESAIQKSRSPEKKDRDRKDREQEFDRKHGNNEKKIQQSQNPDIRSRNKDREGENDRDRKKDRDQQKIQQSHNPEIRDRRDDKNRDREDRDRKNDKHRVERSRSPEERREMSRSPQTAKYSDFDKKRSGKDERHRDEDRRRDKDRDEGRGRSVKESGIGKSRSPEKLKSSMVPKKVNGNFMETGGESESPGRKQVKIGVSTASDMKSSKVKRKVESSDIGKTVHLDDQKEQRRQKESTIGKSKSPEKKLKASKVDAKFQSSIEKTAYLDVLQDPKSKKRGRENESAIIAPINMLDSINPSGLLESTKPKTVKAKSKPRKPKPVEEELPDWDASDESDKKAKKAQVKQSEIAKSKADNLKASKRAQVKESGIEKSSSPVKKSKIKESGIEKSSSPVKKSKVKESGVFAKEAGESKVNRGRSKPKKKAVSESDEEDW